MPYMEKAWKQELYGFLKHRFCLNSYYASDCQTLQHGQKMHPDTVVMGAALEQNSITTTMALSRLGECIVLENMLASTI